LFTGLIEDIGSVVSLRRSSTGARLKVTTKLESLSQGESVAVNGACQTVVETGKGSFTCDVLPETLRVTNLGKLKPGSPVNLERAVGPGDRLGGHIVNGHVDGTGEVTAVSRNPWRIEISVPDEIFAYIVAKGSVAIDGISLTVGPNPAGGRFEVFIIPHTMEHTNLAGVKPGRKVNIEVDIIGKYVYNYLHRTRGKGETP
jgi:riboflavin synthase